MAFTTTGQLFTTSLSGTTTSPWSINLGVYPGGATDLGTVSGLGAGQGVYDLASCNLPTLNPALATTKSVANITTGQNPATTAVVGNVLEYTVTITNSGNLVADSVTLADAIPTGTTYVAASTTMNGTAVADVGGKMPYDPTGTGTREVHTSTQPAGVVQPGANGVVTVKFRVTVATGAPATVSNVATSNYPTVSGGVTTFNNAPSNAAVVNTNSDMGPPVLGALPAVLSPGQSYSGLTLTCTNAGPAPATSASCAPSASAGAISALSCSPTPPATVAAGASISCTFSYTAPGTPGGTNTSQTAITFTGTTGAGNDSNGGTGAGGNNTATASAPIIDAVDDAATVNPGAPVTILSNDQLGSVTNPPVGAGGISAPTILSSTLPGATINGSNQIDVPATTPPGTYTVTYQICAQGTTVCDTAIATITVNAVIDAVNDAPAAISGGTGGSTASVLGNDTLNGAPVTVGGGGNATLTTSGAGLGLNTNPATGSIVMNADGTLTVAPGTTAGTYQYTYRICAVSAPAVCDTAVATVVVNADIAAVDDGSATVPMSTIKAGGSSTTLSVFNNDSINGVVPTSATVTVTESSPLTINADGTLTAPAGLAPGLYTISYQICSTAQPTSCASATAYVKVLPDDATLSSLRDFRAELESGRVLVRWETEGEVGTSGFYVERQDPVTGDYQRLHEDVLPALLDAPQGGSYRLLDATATPGHSHTYRLIEQEVWGGTRIYGPWTVTAAPATPAARQWAAANTEETADPGYSDPAQGYQAQPRPTTRRTLDRSAQALAAFAATPSTPGVAQIPVRKDGLIYISAAQLAPVLGSTTNDIQGWLLNGQLELTNAGRPIAWQATPNASGLLFYGQGIDSLYTLDNLYRLRANQPGLRIDVTPAQNAPPAVAASVFSDTLRAEEDLFAGTVIATDPQEDYWYWLAFAGGNLASGSAKTVTVQIPDVVDGGSLRLYVKGTAMGIHTAQVRLNGQLLGQGTWNDLNDSLLQFPITAQQLLSGSNNIEITALGDRSNLFYLDRIEVDYQRRARAVSDQLTATAASTGPMAIEGFSNAAIQVFDLKDPAKPVAVSQTTITPTANGHSVTFSAQAGRRYHASASVANATLNVQTAALPEQEQISYLVLTAPGLQAAAQTLADYRQSRGQSSRVVTTQEIYDSRNGGIANPYAVQQFLTHAISRWGVRHIVLVGTGSFDYRDLKASGEPQVPTLLTATPNGLYGCDNCLADSNNDGVPEVPIGRIPAASAAEVQAYLGKLQRHEQGTATLRQTGALLVADKTDPAAGRFAQDSDQLAQSLPTDLVARKLYLDTTPIATARTQLMGAFNSGLGWVNYIGHGGAYGLSKSNLLTINDMGALKGSGPLPIVSAMSCAVNRFELPGYIAVGERLMLDSDGGALAVWSATGLSMNQAAAQLNRSLMEAVFQQRSPTLGEAIQQALANHANRPDMPDYMPRIYSLLGDPALTLRP
ncbi:MAG: C25 family cysteine peptidase [Candidatus Contendobacter sp.]